MPSSVNRARRKRAFDRGYQRPQIFNPYKNPILVKLWTRGKELRLQKTGGVMPPLPPPRRDRGRHAKPRGPHSSRPRPPHF